MTALDCQTLTGVSSPFENPIIGETHVSPARHEMSHKIDIDYISKAVLDLTKVFGVREPHNSKQLRKLLSENKVQDCIQEIARMMGLPVKIDFSLVQPGISGESFRSTGLSRTDSEGKGVEGIFAQVSMPTNLPTYGSTALIDFPIRVRASKQSLEVQDVFIVMIAHELSHIILRAVLHNERDNEVYTDLTAMVLGFSEIMASGRKRQSSYYRDDNTQVTETEIYGYLDDAQFECARGGIRKLLKKALGLRGKLRKRVKVLAKSLEKAQQDSASISFLMKFLDQNPNRKYTKRQLEKLIRFHQPNFFDQSKDALTKSLSRLSYWKQELESSTSGAIFPETLSTLLDKIEIDIRNTKEVVARSRHDASTLRSCLTLLERAKLFLGFKI